MTKQRLLSASSLEHNDVKNFDGEDLGEIKDLMIDTENGNVRYAVLSYGGFMGMGDKLFAVPMEALSIDTEEHCCRLNASKEQLKNAPGFDKDHWPNTADPSWSQSVDSYYKGFSRR